MLFAAFSFARGSEHEDDLLDPSLDRPLPQYESTAVGGFDEVPRATAPKAIVPNEPVLNAPLEKSPTPVTKDGPPAAAEIPASDRGINLAPNPLANLLSTKEPQQQTPISDAQEGDSKLDNPKLDLSAKAPVVEKKRVEVPGELTEPKQQPELNSPFDPKPLNPPNFNGGFKTLSKVKPPAKRLTSEKQSPKRKAKQSVFVPKKPSLNYSIYRDQSVYPLDPRKPNNPCTQAPNCGCNGCLARKTGFHGRPHQPREPGGYACGKNCPSKRPQISAYWPRPLSAKLDERDPERAAARYSGCPEKKLTDCFDRLANFRLIDYQRTDNGYCGPESDPYGCLGESKIANQGYYVPVQAQAIPQTESYPLR